MHVLHMSSADFEKEAYKLLKDEKMEDFHGKLENMILVKGKKL